MPAPNPTPGPSQNPLLSLRHPRYGLPAKLVDNFEALGVRAIYPWQASCILGKGLLNRRTKPGLYRPNWRRQITRGRCPPSSTRVIDNPKKKAVLVLPYVALVQEKLKWLALAGRWSEQGHRGNN